MVAYLWDGIRAGLVLSLLVGPLVVLLIQLSLRHGTLASFAGAGGIWTSDLALILLLHFGLGGLGSLLDRSFIMEVVGSVGGIFLVGVGIFMWFRSPPRLDHQEKKVAKKSLASAWFQGFMVNSLNPFTFFFWSAFVVSQVHQPRLSGPESFAVYLGILGVIVLTDSAKVLGARKLQDFLRPRMLVKVQRFGAVALALFGVVLAVRVWWVG